MLLKSRSFFTALFLFSAFSLSAQNPPAEVLHDQYVAEAMARVNVYTPPFTIDLDSAIFNKSMVNIFTSDKYTMASIQVVVDTTGKFVGEIELLEPGVKYPLPGFDAVQERFQTNGRDYIRLFGPIEIEKDSLMMYTYNVADGPTTGFIMTGLCLRQDAEVMAPIFDRAAQSLRLRR
jgi:hypothetical protein